MSDVAYNTDGEIFRKFTDQALDSAVGVFEGAIARFDHDRNATMEKPRGVATAFGVYQDVKREGDMIFGNLHLWDCADADKVASIAQNTPNAVGNSIHAGGICLDSDDDGDGIETCIILMSRTETGLRSSVDLVEDPAATTGIYQNRIKKTVKQSKENPEMDWSKVTLAGLKANCPDLLQSITDAGVKQGTEDAEKISAPKIEVLTQERDKAAKKADTLEAKDARTVQQSKANKVLAESELPDCAKTDVFMNQLLAVKEKKDGDTTVSVEEGMKSLIQDRIVATTPGGVIDNEEKDLLQDKTHKGTTEGLQTIMAM
ncbi:MAG: hypothetical protein KAS32_25950 [Candidatus Peribacteraceae bacterium]|nr:hypothetical protein [Candidatus Peribacteraceae bacterium]